MWSLHGELRSGRKLKAEQDTHIVSNSSDTPFGKSELFQYIKSVGKLLTSAVLVFCQFNALQWHSNPVTKGAGESGRSEARDSNKTASSWIVFSC